MGGDPILSMLLGQMGGGGKTGGGVPPIFGPPDKSQMKDAGNVAGDVSGLTSAMPKMRGMGLPF